MIKIFAGPYPTPVYPTLVSFSTSDADYPHTRPIKGRTFVGDVCARLSHEFFWEMVRKNI